jgi:hypothetical protein
VSAPSWLRVLCPRDFYFKISVRFVTSSDNVIIFVVCIESGEGNLVQKLNGNLRNSCWNGWCVIS